MSKKISYPMFSVSSGTMRNEDLIPTFCGFDLGWLYDALNAYSGPYFLIPLAPIIVGLALSFAYWAIQLGRLIGGRR